MGDHGATDDVRTISDIRSLTALANPDRARIMDLLAAKGPATTTAIARATELATGSVSHHLKVLVAADLVEPDPESATDRRERRWRLVTRGARWSRGDFRGSPAGEAAATAADGALLQREFERARAFLETSDPPWDESAVGVHTWMRLTPEELVELGTELEEVLLRWRRREVPDDGAERTTVLAFARAFPAEP